MSGPLPCIVCRKKLETAIRSDDVVNQPSEATVFTAKGQYGSTVFDPMDPDLFLEVNICDECLRGASEDGDKILLTQRKTTVEWDTKRWYPGV
jgi:hypothetical protein